MNSVGMDSKMRNVVLASAIAACLTGCLDSSMPSTAPVIKNTAPATEHLITYGQSLSVGDRAVVSFPVDDSLPVADDENVGLMFADGTRPMDYTSALVPFAESSTPVDISYNVDTPGETPLYGALLALKGADSALHVGSAAGRGGTAIVGLSKGTAPYARLLQQVSAAKALSPGAYKVMAIIWMQGEADFGNAQYAAELEQLVRDVDHDVRAITGQGPVQFYICETAQLGIGSDQLAVAAAMPQVHIACSDSNYPTVSDGTHLTAASSKAVGTALGTAIRADIL